MTSAYACLPKGAAYRPRLAIRPGTVRRPAERAPGSGDGPDHPVQTRPGGWGRTAPAWRLHSPGARWGIVGEIIGPWSGCCGRNGLAERNLRYVRPYRGRARWFPTVPAGRHWFPTVPFRSGWCRSVPFACVWSRWGGRPLGALGWAASACIEDPGTSPASTCLPGLSSPPLPRRVRAGGYVSAPAKPRNSSSQVSVLSTAFRWRRAARSARLWAWSNSRRVSIPETSPPRRARVRRN